MAHIEQSTFFSIVGERWRALPDRRFHRVLEIGSYDVNGTVRNEFKGVASWTGVDLIPGPGVDVVCRGHEVSDEAGLFDVTIATEVFEHDPNWALTFKRMSELTRPGGAVIVSCASTGRPEHGTARSNQSLSPGTSSIGEDYYQNVLEKAFGSVIKNYDFACFGTRYFRWPADLYFVGVKSLPYVKDPDNSSFCELILDKNDWDRIKRTMPVLDKLVRVPLVLFGSDEKSKEWLKTLAYKYWSTIYLVAAFFHMDQRGRSFPN